MSAQIGQIFVLQRQNSSFPFGSRINSEKAEFHTILIWSQSLQFSKGTQGSSTFWRTLVAGGNSIESGRHHAVSTVGGKFAIQKLNKQDTCHKDSEWFRNFYNRQYGIIGSYRFLIWKLGQRTNSGKALQVLDSTFGGFGGFVKILKHIYWLHNIQTWR